MIIIKDIEKILIADMSKLIGVSSIYVTDDIPSGNVTEERVTIHVKAISNQPIFKKCFVEVNWCVPDNEGVINHERLGEVERQMSDLLESVGEYDDTTYRYSIESEEVIKSELRCHYVNIRLLFEILNVK